MNEAHEVTSVEFQGDSLVLVVDGKRHVIDIAKQSRKLAKATAEQRARFEISPSGYGIHWMELDEDLSIDGLLGVKHACPIAKPARS